MISIGEPRVVKDGSKARLCAAVTIPESAYQKWEVEIGKIARYRGYGQMYRYKAGEIELWYEVDKEYETFLCTEKNDAFVLALLYFAMLTGEDIESRKPVSGELLHNINTNLIPTHCNERAGYSPVRVYAETDLQKLSNAGENGTGISCGIDSFDTILTYLDGNMDEEHKLSAVVVFNMGAFYTMSGMQKCIKGEETLQDWKEEAGRHFELECKRGKSVAKKLGLKFLSVDSNISDVYQGAFLQSHAYRNCSAVLALQKFFGHYYYASAGEPKKPHVGLQEDASDQVQFFTTENVSFYLGSAEKTRIEKTEYIAGFDVAKEYLHVCCEEAENCGKCGKCTRTMLILEVLGKLDDFRECFQDISSYRRKGWRRYVWILDCKKTDYFAQDLFEYMIRKHIGIPLMAKLYHYTYPLRRLIKKVAKR